MQLPPSTPIQGGKYKIEKVLGQGGFGITYLAEQIIIVKGGIGEIETKIKVSIKEFFMKEHCNRDADTSHVSVGSVGSRETVDRFKAKFIKEAQNIAKLKHDHIIKVMDVFEENGTAYYVMEYIDGGSLNDRITQYGAMSETEALHYIRQIADALKYIHSQKINHLDVKPSNILLKEGAVSVLIDFGLAKQYDNSGDQTSSTPVGVSKGYAPMEQYKDGGVNSFSPATDIYSLGATLYKLVTGNTPPHANDVNEDGIPELPSEMSASTKSAITAAMQPKRKDRPQSIEEFLNILGGGVDSEDTEFVKPNEKWQQGSPKSEPKREPKEPTKKSNIGFIVGAAIVALIIIGSIFYFGGSNNTAPMPPQPAPIDVNQEGNTTEQEDIVINTTPIPITTQEVISNEDEEPAVTNSTQNTQEVSINAEQERKAKEQAELEAKRKAKEEAKVEDERIAKERAAAEAKRKIDAERKAEADLVAKYNGVFTKDTYKEMGEPSVVEIPYGFTAIGEKAFEQSLSLTSITIPNSVVSIEESAFIGCNNLISIVIPNSVISIGDGAFWLCSSLTNLTIPNSVTSIGDKAFNHCEKLTANGLKLNSNFILEKGIIYNRSKTKIISTLMSSVNGSIILPNSVNLIASWSFSCCSNLTAITIPNSVTTINELSFLACSKLQTIIIPNSIISIGNSVFWDCSSLTNITIPDSVTSIGDCAFWGCSSLTSIIIPSSVTFIGVDVFNRCSNLKTIYISKKSSIYNQMKEKYGNKVKSN